ncbi:LPD7 domain-containing protein [Acidithiobacillus ferruginosus]|uniref:LPD7 domain-containing protein n=1 Tax=Acidithiobacillus ferruginosus TaxID=3063951 RepID=A0ACD5IE84_9PROT|nr:LPD7 domain-containing protein [Acidithiobacillus ferruginosus]MBU2814586.1 hypothetical protein [Acidithiobacillus ferruginosus]
MGIVDTIKANTPAAREARKHAEIDVEHRGFILTAASEDGEIRVPVASKGDLVSKLDEAATKWPGQVIAIDASETEVLRAAEYAANHDMLIQPKDVQNKKLIEAVAQQYGMIPEVYQELIAEPDLDIGSMGPVIDLSNEKVVSGRLLAVGETQRNGDLGVEVSVADADGKVSRAFVAYRNIDEANLDAVKKLPEVGGEILGSEVHFHMGDGNASIEPIDRQHSLSSAVDTSTVQQPASEADRIADEIQQVAQASEFPPLNSGAQNALPSRSAPEAPKYPRKSPPEILMTSRRGAPYVKDHGDQITVTRRATLAITRRGRDEREQAIATALTAARERFGEPVRIHGTPAFVNETIKQAVQQGIKLEPVGHHAEKEYARVLAGEQKLKDKVLQAGSMAPSKSKEVHKGQGLGIG